jgi:hypothetical protein
MGELSDRTAADAPSVACITRPDSACGAGTHVGSTGSRSSRSADGDRYIHTDGDRHIHANIGPGYAYGDGNPGRCDTIADGQPGTGDADVDFDQRGAIADSFAADRNSAARRRGCGRSDADPSAGHPGPADGHPGPGHPGATDRDARTADAGAANAHTGAPDGHAEADGHRRAADAHAGPADGHRRAADGNAEAHADGYPTHADDQAGGEHGDYGDSYRDAQTVSVCGRSIREPQRTPHQSEPVMLFGA